ncbi:hypothetical protein QA612_17940 [Evansella sp. AB-P1]|uniref:hypothetical protein n=1 Tax=Evansella sp. AB-P1 TaxID=3037653 RepID=UPI00241EEE37|nr:hypothetical protein [Evansella sp. AB-P1]MDG5789346.1 hypothetical protein [Evansella sp. AB-P1]
MEGLLTTYFNCYKDLEEEYVEAELEIKVFDEKTDDEITVGSGQLYLFNVSTCTWDYIWNVADSISGDVEVVVSALKSVHNREDIDGLIAVIDHLEINDEYRRKGYGTYFLQDVIKYLSFMNVDYVGLIPVLEEDGEYTYNERVYRFYVEKGFKPLVSDLGEKPIMGKKLNDGEFHLE